VPEKVTVPRARAWHRSCTTDLATGLRL